MDEALMVPLFLDFAIEVPEDMEIEQNAGQDCVTWGESPCDDDETTIVVLSLTHSTRVSFFISFLLDCWQNR